VGAVYSFDSDSNGPPSHRRREAATFAAATSAGVLDKIRVPTDAVSHVVDPSNPTVREAMGFIATRLKDLIPNFINALRPANVADAVRTSNMQGAATPRLYVIDSPRTNAVVAGRDLRHASICVTTGLLYGLTQDELAGVLSHELAHVLQRSALTRTAAATLAAALSLLRCSVLSLVSALASRFCYWSSHCSPPSPGNWRSAGLANMRPTSCSPAPARSRKGSPCCHRSPRSIRASR
jgi:hypothetical protein